MENNAGLCPPRNGFGRQSRVCGLSARPEMILTILRSVVPDNDSLRAPPAFFFSTQMTRGFPKSILPGGNESPGEQKSNNGHQAPRAELLHPRCREQLTGRREDSRHIFGL